jgi:hypothetical protein
MDSVLSPPLASLDPPKGRVMTINLQDNNLEDARLPLKSGDRSCCWCSSGLEAQPTEPSVQCPTRTRRALREREGRIKKPTW